VEKNFSLLPSGGLILVIEPCSEAHSEYFLVIPKHHFRHFKLTLYFPGLRPRAGTFTPLNKLPSEKSVVLGLISTKTSELEDRNTLLKRIDEAAGFVALDQICISPQCGFSSGMYGNPITIDDQRRKLELLVSVANEVWGS
jgi:methionine synthase II (cobalamin-independent)